MPLSDPRASLLHRCARWAHLLLLQCLAVAAESPVNFSRAPTSMSASKSSTGQGVRCFILMVCPRRKQHQSSPLEHLPERCVFREGWWEAPAAGAIRLMNYRPLHVRYRWRQMLVSLFLGCALFYICYLVHGHFINVSDDIKGLLFLFIKQWLKSSQKQPPYYSFLTPTHSLTCP